MLEASGSSRRRRPPRERNAVRVTEITVHYRSTPWHHDRANGRLEFGRATRRGIVVLPENRALTDYLHGVCGWFSWDNGWSLQRRRDTRNITMHAFVGGRIVEVSTREPTLLGVGEGHVEMVLRGRGEAREVIQMRWLIPSTQPEGAAEPTTRSSSVRTITEHFEDDEPTGRVVLELTLAPRERQVMTAFARPLLRGEQATAPTARDVAVVLFRDAASTAPVERAVDRVKAKVKAAQKQLHEPVIADRQGVRSSDLLARWLVDHGVITMVDVEQLPDNG